MSHAGQHTAPTQVSPEDHRLSDKSLWQKTNSGSIGGRETIGASGPVTSDAAAMKIVRSWCERDGLPAFLGEREPLDDLSVTHGICPRHMAQLLGSLPSASFPGVELLVIVRPSDRALFEHLLWATSGVPNIRAIMERRQGERRRRAEKPRPMSAAGASVV